MDTGAPAVFEAAFEADGIRVAVDVLKREAGNAWTLIEAKSASSQKPEHVQDAAVQLHVLAKAGVDVGRVDIMHLNNEYRLAGESVADVVPAQLLQRTDVTTPATRRGS